MTSKYDGLGDYLVATGAATITLTFAEVETIVGPLPVAARSFVTWWGVTASGRYNNAHALGWWHAGYIADRPDFAAQTVTFRRQTR